MKNKTFRLVAIALTVAIAAGACSSNTEKGEGMVLDPDGATETTTVTDTSTSEATNSGLQPAIDTIVADSGVPALGAAVFNSDGLVEIAASGIREQGSSAEVTIDDRFHIGSNTKAMTAALFVRLGEQGSGLTLDTTLSEAFPDIDVHADYVAVTMAQLMSHSGGVPTTSVPDELAELPVTEGRALGTQLLLSEPSDIEAGTLSRYSNLNYILIGAALEAATGQSWEELMVAEMFEPLNMDSCGFGVPGVEGEVTEPRGHDVDGDSVFGDNPAILGPAGTVHCSMTDWGTLLVELLNATTGHSDYLTQAGAERLFEPTSAPAEGIPGAHHALGWVVLEGPDGPVYTHDGSNRFWFSQAVINPAIGSVILTVTNEAGTGQQAAAEAIKVLADISQVELVNAEPSEADSFREEQVDIGGRELFLRCQGVGSPTVILEHGLASDAASWQTVQEDLADHTKVCAASRAGMTLSDPIPGDESRTAQDAVDDLVKVLEVADVPGPYVLVGHSFGGHVVRLFADQYPDDVVAMVLVDSAHEDQAQRQAERLEHLLSPEAWADIVIPADSDNPERMGLAASGALVAQADSLGDLPLTVLEAGGQDPGDLDEVQQGMVDLWSSFQVELAALSTNSTHTVVPNSGHFIQIDQPDVVVEAIRSAVSQ